MDLRDGKTMLFMPRLPAAYAVTAPPSYVCCNAHALLHACMCLSRRPLPKGHGCCQSIAMLLLGGLKTQQLISAVIAGVDGRDQGPRLLSGAVQRRCCALCRRDCLCSQGPSAAGAACAAWEEHRQVDRRPFGPTLCYLQHLPALTATWYLLQGCLHGASWKRVFMQCASISCKGVFTAPKLSLQWAVH